MRSFYPDLRLLAGGALGFALLLATIPAQAQDSAAEEAPAASEAVAEPAPADAPAEETAAAPESAEAAPAEPAAGDVTAAEPGPADATPATEPAPATEVAAPAETIPVAPVNETPEPELTVREGAQKLDTVEVTGSRIRRTDFETANPVLVITRKDIERTGLVSIGDILQNLPQAGAALNTAFNNGGTGATEIDLRNLGSNRVLVLVNGRRWVGGVRTLNTSGVDLNTIPTSIIDSIEILKDGASAVYGSDAIAGVINIKTRRDFQGFQSRGQYEVLSQRSTDAVTGDYRFSLSAQPDDNFADPTTTQTFTDPGPGADLGPLTFNDDGQTYTVNLAAGTIGDKSSAFLDVSYTSIAPVFAGGRSTAAFPTAGPLTNVNGQLSSSGANNGQAHSRGSLFTPGANLIFVATDTNARAINGSSSGLASDPESICYPILSGPDTATGTIAGETGLDIGTLPNPGGVLTAANLCVAQTLQPGQRGETQRAGRMDYGHQYVPFDFNLDGYNFAPINYLITPQERTSIFGQFSQEFANGIRFSSELLYNNRRSEQQLAHQPMGAGDLLAGTAFGMLYVAADNPYNPTNPASPYYIPGTQAQDIGRADAAAGLVGLGATVRRMLEGGTRNFSQNVDTMRIGGGFDGQFDLLNRVFVWDGGIVYNESKQTDLTTGEYDMLRVARALGPLADCVGTAATAPPPDADGCVPLNLFGPIGSVTKEMLDYVLTTTTDTDRATQTFAYANFSTDFAEAQAFLPGPIGLAVGLEVRKEAFESIPDGAKVQGTNANLSETATKGSYTVKEAYLEAAIPLLADKPFVDSLNLSLATRFSQYDIGENTFDNLASKLGIEFRPTSQLLLRGTYSEAFRAPAITDLFLGRALSFPEVEDPCSDYPNNENPNVQQNCAADGVPSGYTQANSQIPSAFGGNPNLTPEDAITQSFGVVWSPEFAPDLNIAVDWYNVVIEDVISFTGPAQVLASCYQSDPGSRALCDQVTRGPTGELQGVDNLAANFAEQEVEGIDLNVDWRLPFEFLQPFGSFKVVLDVAYSSKFLFSAEALDADGNLVRQTQDLIGIATGGGGFPEYKINGSLDWDLGKWSASWFMRYTGSMYEFCDDGRAEPGRAAEPGVLTNPTSIPSLEEAGFCDGGVQTLAGITGITNRIEPVLYHDMQMGYSFEEFGTDVTFGVRNVFNKNPPVFGTAFASSFDPTLYEFEDSRSMYLKFVKNF